jgi:hypothetical protein
MRWRRPAGGDHRADIARHPRSQIAQAAIEIDHQPSSRLAIEQRAFGHDLAQHFLQAQRLRAQLHFVGAMGFGPVP